MLTPIFMAAKWLPQSQAQTHECGCEGGSTSYCGSFFVVVEEETFPRRFPADSHSVPLTRITAHVPVLYEKRMKKDLILSALPVRGELGYHRTELRRFSNCWVCGWWCLLHSPWTNLGRGWVKEHSRIGEDSYDTSQNLLESWLCAIY